MNPRSFPTFVRLFEWCKSKRASPGARLLKWATIAALAVGVLYLVFEPKVTYETTGKGGCSRMQGVEVCLGYWGTKSLHLRGLPPIVIGHWESSI